jgi:hypothetical protein
MSTLNQSPKSQFNDQEDEIDDINIGTMTLVLLGLSCIFYFYPPKKIKKHKS